MKEVSGSTKYVDMKQNVIAGDTAFEAIMTVATNDFNLVVNGGAVLTDSTGVVPAATTKVYLGQASDGTGFWNGFLTRLTLWNRRLSNGRLQDKTAFLDWWRGVMFAANDNEPFSMIEVAA